MDNKKELLADIKLRFTIECPNFEECYAFGYEWALAELSEDENPFDRGTRESELWSEGWWDGFYGEAPLYALSDDTTSNIKRIQGAANDEMYKVQPERKAFISKVLEITGVIAVSALVGYQVIDLVA